MFKSPPKQEPVFEQGNNIVGLLTGRYFGDPRDRPIVLAAHWDVVANTSGFNDNGSGVSAMLETARLLSGADCFAESQLHTIIFVALDSEVGIATVIII